MHKETSMFIFIDWWGHKLNTYDLLVSQVHRTVLSSGYFNRKNNRAIWFV